MKSGICNYNPNLQCGKKSCPLDDKQFTSLIDRFLYTGRTAKSVILDPGACGGGSSKVEDYYVFLARLATAFTDNACEHYNDIQRGGKMTYRICRELRACNVKLKEVMMTG